MKNSLASSVHAAALAVTLFALPVVTFAQSGDTPAATDPAARLLASAGSVPVKAAGPYVEIGTYRVQVSVKLGKPNFVLPDGTCLYQSFSVPDSDARGTLVVRFTNGRVSGLSLASPATVAALRKSFQQGADKVLTARR
jgi:hypothetical protein